MFIKSNVFFILLVTLPLMAEKENNNTHKVNTLIPNVPAFSITYQDEALQCSPTRQIETKPSPKSTNEYLY